MPKTSAEFDPRILLIPVDRDGVATFKNHFFHTTNSLVPVLSLLIYPQTWRPRLCFVPLIYGLGYLTMAGAMQANGGFCSALYVHSVAMFCYGCGCKWQVARIPQILIFKTLQQSGWIALYIDMGCKTTVGPIQMWSYNYCITNEFFKPIGGIHTVPY